jgi:predicted nucleic acid-binding protein
MERKPSIYVDTNICRDCIKNRNYDSIDLLCIIRERGWECITSIFTLMESLDNEKDDSFFHKKVRLGWEVNKINRERYHKDLNKEDLEECGDRVKCFFRSYNFIEPRTLTDEGWDFALDLSTKSNLSAADVIHFAVALFSKCNLIVTSDEEFIKHSTTLLKEFGLWNHTRVCRPKDAIKTLKKMKYKVD